MSVKSHSPRDTMACKSNVFNTTAPEQASISNKFINKCISDCQQSDEVKYAMNDVLRHLRHPIKEKKVPKDRKLDRHKNRKVPPHVKLERRIQREIVYFNRRCERALQAKERAIMRLNDRDVK